MSFTHLELVIKHSKAKGPDKAIMLVLAYRANEKGECWPGLNRIAREAGLDRRHVIRRLKAIASSGELLIQRQNHDVQTRGGRQAVNRYKLNVNPLKGGGCVSLPLSSKGVAVESKGGGCMARKGVAVESKGGGQVSPESSLNSQSEPSRNRQGKKPADLPDDKSSSSEGKHRIDYETAKPPEVQDYTNIHNPANDPILVAMAITNERSKQGWGYWVKVLNQARKEYGNERAERLFRGCLAELFGEIKQGEADNPGAVLNVKLKNAFKL